MSKIFYKFIFFFIILLSFFLFDELFNEKEIYSQHKIDNLNFKIDKFEKNRISEMKITLKKNTYKNLIALTQIIEKKDIKNYNLFNVWKPIVIDYENDKYKASLKIHGKSPDDPHSNGFIYRSYSIKLEKGKKINGYRKFKLITVKRFIESKNTLTSNFIDNFYKLPVYPVQVFFDQKFSESEYIFIPYLDDVYADLNGKSDNIFMRQYETSNTNYGEADLKSFVLFSEFKNKNSIKYLDEELKKFLNYQTNYNDELKEQIINQHKKMNNSIFHNNFNEYRKYFNKDNVIEFLTIYIFYGHMGHQLTRQNLQTVYETSSGLNYLFLNYDVRERPLIFKISNENLFYQSLQKYEGSISKDLPLIEYFLQNNEISTQVFLNVKNLLNNEDNPEKIFEQYHFFLKNLLSKYSLSVVREIYNNGVIIKFSGDSLLPIQLNSLQKSECFNKNKGAT